MQSEDLPNFYRLMKKRIVGNYTPNPSKGNVFVAVTSQAVEDVLLNKSSSFVKDGEHNRLKLALGQGIFTNEEPRHMEKKKQISPAFDHSHVNDYKEKISILIDDMISTWDGNVNVRDEIGYFVYKSTMSIFFSETSEVHFEKIRKNISILSDKIAFDEVDDEMFRIIKVLREITNNLVNKRIESKEVVHDFLGILINSYNNNTMTLDDVYDEAITILLASYETTAYALEWAVYYLAVNQDWQEKISREENVNAFIKEVFRIAAPIWKSSRMAIEDVTIDGTELLSGTQVVVSSFIMHRDKNVFKDPDSFKPERWFEDQDLAKGDYFPFLFGKRQCIGKEFALMEMDLLLTKISRRFILESVNKSARHIAGMAFKPKFPTTVSVQNK